MASQQLPLFYPQPEIPQWQREELARLCALERHLRQALRYGGRGKSYLSARGVSLDLALRCGVGYLPYALRARLDARERQSLARWSERVIFPLVSPEGRGYIGRVLHGWRAGMDENEHKALLDGIEGQRRWLKTNPAGWFSVPFEGLAEHIVLVEGGFDRLTLLQTGFRPQEVVALVGTSAHLDWLLLYAPQVKGVVLALDCDQGGHEAARKLAAQCREIGLPMRVCEVASDRLGKDWNERWRNLGRECLRPLHAAYRALRWQARSA